MKYSKFQISDYWKNFFELNEVVFKVWEGNCGWEKAKWFELTDFIVYCFSSIFDNPKGLPYGVWAIIKYKQGERYDTEGEIFSRSKSSQCQRKMDFIFNNQKRCIWYNKDFVGLIRAGRNKYQKRVDYWNNIPK